MYLFHLLAILYFGFIYTENKDKFEGVYQIDSLQGYTLTFDIFRDKLIFKRFNIKRNYFKFISINYEQYYIESVSSNKRCQRIIIMFYYQIKKIRYKRKYLEYY